MAPSNPAFSMGSRSAWQSVVGSVSVERRQARGAVTTTLAVPAPTVVGPVRSKTAKVVQDYPGWTNSSKWGSVLDCTSAPAEGLV